MFIPIRTLPTPRGQSTWSISVRNLAPATYETGRSSNPGCQAASRTRTSCKKRKTLMLGVTGYETEHPTSESHQQGALIILNYQLDEAYSPLRGGGSTEESPLSDRSVGMPMINCLTSQCRRAEHCGRYQSFSGWSWAA